LLGTGKVTTRLDEYNNLRLRLIGGHQWVNAACAIGAVEALQNFGFNVKPAAIRRGLYHTLWPGRCEVVARRPFIILDGAQNVASSHTLRQAILKGFLYSKLILILGISSDKDIKGICQELCPLADQIILTQANNPRAASAEGIEKIIKSQGQSGARLQVIKTKTVKEALRLAKVKADRQDLILVAGSLFVVGEARHMIIKKDG
jgi:dihydrofolate synthase/folylpolyglutamate synthase